ncbi:MAG: preprotein translocase subunit SecG [Cycloclasticus sp. Phe_18]|jgi:preprotein translocase subunit SecG|nr:MAG: preprotein translocase subunit SecG [Cycloclasticus sp. Phe_18]MDF1688206.1 preprotein translocase subunit SecG [Cycloclasticus sp.]
MSIFAIVLSVHVLIAALMIGLILIQHGKGADAGAAFGSGASGTVFGAKGSGNFLSRSTAILAALFFSTSLALAYLGGNRAEPEDIVDGLTISNPAPSIETTPADLINNIAQPSNKVDDVEGMKPADDVPIPE